MGKKKVWGCCPLNILVITIVASLALFVISLIKGPLWAAATGTQASGVFNTPVPAPDPAPEGLFSIFGFPVTNCLLAAWISILVLFLFFFIGTHKMKLIPSGFQNLVEYLFEMGSDFVDDTVGKENGRKFFPIVITIFLFVIINAWLNLIPGYHSIHATGATGEVVPLLRNANTDINLPLALAIVSAIFVEYWGFKSKGFFRYGRKFVNFVPLGQGFKTLFTGKIKAGFGGIGMGIIAVFTGLLEFVSELLRLVSFTFRLFGNMTAGSLLVCSLIFLIPWVMPLPFYGLEMFLGFVQALIFGGLTLAFVLVAITPEED
jgi:F-type H+-transporting ATPase subunit a